MAISVFNAVDAALPTAVGAWFTWLTVMVTAATLLSSEPSLALKEKVSIPWKWSAGANVTFGGVPDNEPCAGLETTVYVSAAPSGSMADSVIGLEMSSFVEMD